jgi:hypothetical protein
MTRTVALLRAYMAQRGLFARVAKKLRLDPSYISRVANGQRHSRSISQAIEAELNKMYAASRKINNSSTKKLAHPPSSKHQVTFHRGRF